MQDEPTLSKYPKALLLLVLLVLVGGGLYYLFANVAATRPAPSGQKIEVKTFIGVTSADIKDPTTRVSYTLTYPSPTLVVQQMNNGESQIVRSAATTEAILMRVRYIPNAKTPADAWVSYRGGISDSKKSAPDWVEEAPLFTVKEGQSVGYAQNGQDYVVTQLTAAPGWFFIFWIEHKDTVTDMIPIVASLAVKTI